MADLNATLRAAKREFSEFLEYVWEFIAGMSTAELLLAGCMFCLIVMWMFVRRSDDGDDTPGMARQFGFAVMTVTIFGVAFGFTLGPSVLSLTQTLL